MKTIIITKSSPFLVRLFIKWYIWMWNPNLTTLTNCRIIWGTIFFPLAFASISKKVFRYIPRISILALTISLILFALEWWHRPAYFLLSYAIVSAPLYFFLDLYRTSKNRKIAIEPVIEEESPRLDAALDKIMESHLGSIIASFVCWLLDIKERKCSFIQLEL